MSRRGVEHGLDQSAERRAVALQGTLEPKPLADRHDGHAVPAQIAAQQDDIARPDPRGRDFHPRPHPADAGRIDENAVRLAPIDHLRIAGDDPHADCPSRLGHRGHDAAKRLELQAFFENEAGIR